MHSSPVPVALTPRGFRAEPGGRVRRVTVAFNGMPKDRALERTAADYSARTGGTLRVASFSVRPNCCSPTTLAGSGEDLVVDEWSRQTGKVINEELITWAAFRACRAGPSP